MVDIIYILFYKFISVKQLIKSKASKSFGQQVNQKNKIHPIEQTLKKGLHYWVLYLS